MKAFALTIAALGLGAGLHAGSLTTTDGVTYNNITLQATEPDGLSIEYTPAGGGMGLAKVKFTRLSANQQQQFGYDPARAKDYEEQATKAMAAYRVTAAEWEQAAQAARREQAAHDLEQEKADREYMLAQEKLRLEAANNSAADYGGGYAYGYGGGYWPYANGALGLRHGGLSASRAQNAGQRNVTSQFRGVDEFRYINGQPLRPGSVRLATGARQSATR